MYVFPFEKLEVWQAAVNLAEYVLDLLDRFPENRHLRLVSQMESAVTSPAQNIAEGRTPIQKGICTISPYRPRFFVEVATLGEIFRRKKLFQGEEAVEIRRRCETIDRKLNGLINSLRGKKKLVEERGAARLEESLRG